MRRVDAGYMHTYNATDATNYVCRYECIYECSNTRTAYFGDLSRSLTESRKIDAVGYDARNGVRTIENKTKGKLKYTPVGVHTYTAGGSLVIMKSNERARVADIFDVSINYNEFWHMEC